MNTPAATKVFYASLTIATAVPAGLLINYVITGRGACPFIRPFHYAAVLVAAVVATWSFASMQRRFPGLLFNRTSRGAPFHLVVFCLVWAAAMSLAESSARLWERMTHTRGQLGEVGYGWFYWDDSGMGANPTTMLYALIVGLLFAPWFIALIPTLVYAVFSVFPRDSSTDRNA